VYFFFLRPAEPTGPPPEPTYFVWDFDMVELQHIVIRLPHEDKSEAFVKHGKLEGKLKIELEQEFHELSEGELILQLVEGEVTPGESITVLVTFRENPVVDALTKVNDEEVGTTGEDGHISFVVPNDEELEIEAEKDDRYFYFDYPEGPRVDMNRWGGGIPLLLSGPGADRRIAKDATEKKLDEFGFTEPQMEIALTLENGDVINIAVGDSTPDGSTYYVKLVNSNNVYTVDSTWYGVFEDLVLNPPYPTPEED